ncbi:MAG: hypothetical protein WKF51_05475 [Geodermatophilaceae bacterium]
MSVFDVGFIMWGYFALYIIVTIAYYVWMNAKNRRDPGVAPQAPSRRDG